MLKPAVHSSIFICRDSVDFRVFVGLRRGGTFRQARDKSLQAGALDRWPILARAHGIGRGAGWTGHARQFFPAGSFARLFGNQRALPQVKAASRTVSLDCPILIVDIAAGQSDAFSKLPSFQSSLQSDNVMASARER